MAKMTVYILPTKTRGCAPQSPETDENDENGGCPSDKTRVCQKQGFRLDFPKEGAHFKKKNCIGPEDFAWKVGQQEVWGSTSAARK